MTQHVPPPDRARAEATPPPQPADLDAVGLSPRMMRDVLLKTMFRMGVERASEVAAALALPPRPVGDLIDQARAALLLEAMGNAGGADMPYRLTESGRARAAEALAQSEYCGAMPVPLAAYEAQVARQRIRGRPITRPELTRAFGDMIVPLGLLGQLGPAVCAGRSILLYGPPGNGKSSITNAIRGALGDTVHVPRALAHAGQVIAMFDPAVHDALPEPEPDPHALRRDPDARDRRYVACRRPSVVTGGELKLDMLDLRYDPGPRTYQAPLQLKATGGVFVVDDLGRQEEPPQALINRWIVPMEEGHDILALQSGEKITVPFDTLVIFSTNFHPNEIFDAAALRRVFFKIRVGGPSREDFLRILMRVADARGLAVDEPSVRHLLSLYPATGVALANYQPAFLVDQMLSICAFEGAAPRTTPALVDRAWANMFVAEE